MVSPIDEAQRVPESVLDPTSVKRLSVPDAPKSMFPDSVLDQVEGCLRYGFLPSTPYSPIFAEGFYTLCSSCTTTSSFAAILMVYFGLYANSFPLDP